MNSFSENSASTSSDHTKPSMIVFFDTEFSGLNSDPHLLSIGLVANTGNELYIEFTDGWMESNCSHWVLEHVVPMLGKGEKLSRMAAASRIMSWLSSLSISPILLGETDYDTSLFADLMSDCGFGHDHFRLKELEYNEKSEAAAFRAEKQRYFDVQRTVPHHALTDARAFHYAWHRIFADNPLIEGLEDGG